MTYTTEAIVLTYERYRDYDRLYTVYSRDYGKLVLRARGANKIKSKLAGHLEPCCKSALMIAASSRALPLLAQARVVTSFRRLRTDSGRFQTVLPVLEALDVLTGVENPDTDIFHLLERTLARLAVGEGEEQATAVWYCYLLQLLVHLGHAPDALHHTALKPLLIADIGRDAILLEAVARSYIHEYARRALDEKRLFTFPLPL